MPGRQAAPGQWPYCQRPAAYFSRVLVPFIFCALNVLRKAGSSRSMSSKYDDRAGVCWLAL